MGHVGGLVMQALQGTLNSTTCASLSHKLWPQMLQMNMLYDKISTDTDELHVPLADSHHLPYLQQYA